MRTLALLASLLALGACQTLPAVVLSGGDTFEIRYDAGAQSSADADARARQYCNGDAEFVSEQTKYDGFAYRTYRCAGGR